MSNKENKYIIRMTKRFKKHLKRMEKRKAPRTLPRPRTYRNPKRKPGMSCFA